MGREYPDRPVPAVGAFIVNGGRILLVKRGHEPCAGKWSVPGGVIELGEKVEEALRREIKEELGIDVEIMGILDIYDSIFRDKRGNIRYHYVIIDFVAKPKTKNIKPSDEILDYKWVELSEIEEMDVTPSLKRMIKKYGDLLLLV